MKKPITREELRQELNTLRQLQAQAEELSPEAVLQAIRTIEASYKQPSKASLLSSEETAQPIREDEEERDRLISQLYAEASKRIIGQQPAEPKSSTPPKPKSSTPAKRGRKPAKPLIDLIRAEDKEGVLSQLQQLINNTGRDFCHFALLEAYKEGILSSQPEAPAVLKAFTGVGSCTSYRHADPSKKPTIEQRNIINNALANIKAAL